MSKAGAPNPRSNLGKNFMKQMYALTDYAQSEGDSLRNKKPKRWYRPGGFKADLFDMPAYHEPFDRTQHEEEFVEAHKKPSDPGTTGDGIISTLQGDWLACMERAFRARHHTPVRRRIHPAARMIGHSAPWGVILGGAQEYIVHLDKLNKSETPDGIV